MVQTEKIKNITMSGKLMEKYCEAQNVDLTAVNELHQVYLRIQTSQRMKLLKRLEHGLVLAFK